MVDWTPPRSLQDTEDLQEASRYAHLDSVTVDARLQYPPRERVPRSARSRGEMYTIREGDRIDMIAYTMLSDSRLWWLIADMNPLKILDPMDLVPGTEIFVPSLEAASRYL